MVDETGAVNKVGLAFTKQELEDIQHEGPLMPQHLGAFKIKESFMDMSSSDEELVGPNAQTADQFAGHDINHEQSALATMDRNTNQDPMYSSKYYNKKDNFRVRQNVESKENTEVSLQNMLIPANFDFEQLFVL